ncbi:hypothetical protein C8Q75DRAFT_743072, partial [Abortiporus biennis]
MAYPVRRVPLNLDIIFIVMEFIDSRATLLSLMKTCKPFYHSGVRFLLGFPIVLRYERAVVNFLEYISYSEPSRYTYIKDLTIDIRKSDHPSICILFSGLFKDGTQLESLHL